MVTSGAIARGMRLMELPMRPRAMEELQAASAVGQGKLYRSYDELLQARGVRSAQVLLTFFDMSARTHYLNARHTLRKLLDWHVVPVINENDTTTTDEISFGDNDFLAAQVAILLGADALVLLTDTGGLYTSDPEHRPLGRADRRGPRARAARPLRHRAVDLAARARAACAPRWWRRTWPRPPGIPVVITGGTDRAAVAAALSGEHTGTRFHPQRRAGVELQAVAQVRQAHPRPAGGRRGGRARPARARAPACCRWAWSEVEGEFDAGDAVEVTCNGRTGGQGHRRLLVG